ncbi:MAG: hypothetical protein Q4P18_06485 [Methanobrevibacter sp.]|uniref:hypothetical protein n=1 Tax=Methanobrevibacter sp. TaxID=66852 RepID=UPI0026DFF21F|nr:hypothetical protein [Methanobrevibacter sp.]MDO5849162.1 hypothetical protein [Methanobrevibacter sp.]
MSKKSATVFVIFIVAIIAFCLANVVASMVGTYSLNVFDNDDLVNNTTDLNDTNDSYINVETSSSDNVKSEDVYVSDNSYDNPGGDTPQVEPVNPDPQTNVTY